MAERKVVNAKTDEGKDIVLVVNKPNAKTLRDAQIASSQAFSDALKSKALLRAALHEHMVQQGLWDDAKEKQITDLAKKLNDGERRLARGGAGGFSKTDAYKLALQMSEWRNEQRNLLAQTRQLDEYTCEGQAENARFDYLVSTCVNLESGQSAYNSLEDYREKSSQPYSYAAALALSELISTVDAKWEHKLPENKFLLQHKFVDDELRLINKEGKFVSRDGKLVNDKGRYVDEKGNLVDVNGKPVTEEGDPIEEFVEFAEEK